MAREGRLGGAGPRQPHGHRQPATINFGTAWYVGDTLAVRRCLRAQDYDSSALAYPGRLEGIREPLRICRADHPVDDRFGRVELARFDGHGVLASIHRLTGGFRGDQRNLIRRGGTRAGVPDLAVRGVPRVDASRRSRDWMVRTRAGLGGR